MGWKTWPYWLRGGLIGFVAGFLLIFIDIITGGFAGGDCPYSLICLGEGLAITMIIGWFFSIPGAIIGAISGLIVGKIKSKKKTSVSTLQSS